MIWTRSRERNGRAWHVVTRREPAYPDGGRTACGVVVRLHRRRNRVVAAATLPGPACQSCLWQLPQDAAPSLFQELPHA